MKIIIDIPENVIEGAKSSPNYYPTYHFEKIWRAIANGIPYEETPQDDLISREALKKVIRENGYSHYYEIFAIIDNAPTVETSKVEYKAYNEGFKDGVEQGIKLSETPGEWIDHSEDYGYVECPKCEHLTNCEGNVDELHYCWHCGAKLVKGKKAGVEE